MASPSEPEHIEHSDRKRSGNETPSLSAERGENQRQERIQGSRRTGQPSRGGRGGAYGRQNRRPPNSRPPGSGTKSNPTVRPYSDLSKQQGENDMSGISSTRNDHQEATEDGSEVELCIICASPVVHHAVSPCNHRTCHICALRMRALYKTKACAHCRVSSMHSMVNLQLLMGYPPDELRIRDIHGRRI